MSSTRSVRRNGAAASPRFVAPPARAQFVWQEHYCQDRREGALSRWEATSSPALAGMTRHASLKSCSSLTAAIDGHQQGENTSAAGRTDGRHWGHPDDR